MLHKVIAFLLGLFSGVLYLVIGGSYLAWNSSHGYGWGMIEWSITSIANGDKIGNVIYLHDVLIFLIIATPIVYASNWLYDRTKASIFTWGMLIATFGSSYGILIGGVSGFPWISVFVIAMLPFPVLMILRKITHRVSRSAA